MVKSWILYIYIYPYRGMVINPVIPIMRLPIMGWMTIPHMTYTCLDRGTCDGGGISYRFIPAMTEGLEVRRQGNVRNTSKLSGHSP